MSTLFSTKQLLFIKSLFLTRFILKIPENCNSNNCRQKIVLKIPSNYHNSSVLSISRKLYEKCTYSHFYSLLLKFKVLFKTQFVLTNNHSTNHALINLSDLIEKYLVITLILVESPLTFQTHWTLQTTIFYMINLNITLSVDQL